MKILVTGMRNFFVNFITEVSSVVERERRRFYMDPGRMIVGLPAP